MIALCIYVEHNMNEYERRDSRLSSLARIVRTVPLLRLVASSVFILPLFSSLLRAAASVLLAQQSISAAARWRLQTLLHLLGLSPRAALGWAELAWLSRTACARPV